MHWSLDEVYKIENTIQYSTIIHNTWLYTKRILQWYTKTNRTVHKKTMK